MMTPSLGLALVAALSLVRLALAQPCQEIEINGFAYGGPSYDFIRLPTGQSETSEHAQRLLRYERLTCNALGVCKGAIYLHGQRATVVQLHSYYDDQMPNNTRLVYLAATELDFPSGYRMVSIWIDETAARCVAPK